MNHALEMRRCLEEVDVDGARRLWRHMAPHLPQPANDTEVLTTIHYARTQAESMGLRLRAYSHRWLLDHGLPSGLPDPLKPKAERLYPRVVSAVGISVMSKFPQVVSEVRGAMVDVVENCFADGKTDTEYVRPRMMEAKLIAQKRLGM